MLVFVSPLLPFFPDRLLALRPGRKRPFINQSTGGKDLDLQGGCSSSFVVEEEKILLVSSIPQPERVFSDAKAAFRIVELAIPRKAKKI